MTRESHLRQAEHIVKRFTKAELIPWLARLLTTHAEEKAAEHARNEKLWEENMKLKRTCDSLKAVRDVLAAVVRSRASKPFSEEQLTLALGGDRQIDNEDDSDSPKAILEKILDDCESVAENIYHDAGVLEEALDAACADRKKLLAHAKLTEREWFAMGGASFADLEV